METIKISPYSLDHSVFKLISANGNFVERVRYSTGLSLNEFESVLKSRHTSKLVELSIHNDCNHCCSHCYQYEEGSTYNLNILEIPKILKAFESNNYRKYFFPREPLLLPDLIPFYKKEKCTEISTNACALAKNPGILETLHKYGINSIFVSLHGGVLAHCNLTRTSSSSYYDLIKSLRVIVKKGFQLEVITNLYKGNVSALDFLPELLVDIGVSKWWIQRIMPAGLAKRWRISDFIYGNECKEVLLRYAQIKQQFNLAKLKVGLDLSWGPNFYSKNMLKFLAGQVQKWPWTRYVCPVVAKNSILISMESGKVYPCWFFESFPDLKIGQIINNHYIVDNDQYFEEDNLLSELRGQCSECHYKKHCLGGCRAIAFSFAVLRGESYPIYAGQDFCLTRWIDQELEAKSVTK